MILQRVEQDFIKIVLGSGVLEGSRGLYGGVPGLRSEWGLRGAAGGGAQQGQAKPSRAEPSRDTQRSERPERGPNFGPFFRKFSIGVIRGPPGVARA